MRTVIPFDTTTPKRRLSPVLAPEERGAFALAMLRDVIRATRETLLDPTVLSTAPLPDSLSVPVEVDDRPLDAVVGAAIETGTPLAVVMADLPLVEPQVLRRLREQDGDVVLAPGRGGGTNAMVVRDPAFEPDYHGASIADHRQIARERDLALGEVDSFRLAADVDDPADLLAVLLHGDGESARWLESAGFRIETSSGRPAVVRPGGPTDGSRSSGADSD
jgi:2-phospho-L-lactate guanylyltransferase